MKWLGRLWRFFQAELLVLASAAFNRRTPLKLRALLGLALLYFISPVDIIPDAIPLAGILDDAIVVPALLAAVLNQLPPGVRAESEAHAARIERKCPGFCWRYQRCCFYGWGCSCGRPIPSSCG